MPEIGSYQWTQNCDWGLCRGGLWRYGTRHNSLCYNRLQTQWLEWGRMTRRCGPWIPEIQFTSKHCPKAPCMADCGVMIALTCSVTHPTLKGYNEKREITYLNTFSPTSPKASQVLHLLLLIDNEVPKNLSFALQELSELNPKKLHRGDRPLTLRGISLPPSDSHVFLSSCYSLFIRSN
jgi:hypothetical protein